MHPLVKLAASAQPAEKKYILFVGAGVSKDAGLPTAWDIMIETAKLLYVSENSEIDPDVDIEKWFEESKYAEMEYSELMEALFPNYPDQQSFFEKNLGNREPGKAHELIAELAKRGIIRAIVTTNFDNYIEKALSLKGISYQVLANDEDLKTTEPLIHCKKVRIYKPHGDLGKGALKNTPKDLESLSKPMEDELTKVLNEHGIIVLGYSGRDKGIRKVFRNINCSYYPLFWVSQSAPSKDMETILNSKDCSFITCKGASQFLSDILNIHEKLNKLGPLSSSSRSLDDLEQAIISKSPSVAALFDEFMESIINQLKDNKPDFQKYAEAEYDEAIIEQIEKGKSITYDLAGLSLMVSRYNIVELIEKTYDHFGKALRLCENPDDFTGQWRDTDFDGYKFLVYEMFVLFIAALIKYDNWEIIGKMLSRELFIEKKYNSEYKPFTGISRYFIESLEEYRKHRLNSGSISIASDIVKGHSFKDDMSKFINHYEFMEADYYLFLRSVIHEKNPAEPKNYWLPQSCVYLDKVPTYLIKAQSRRFIHEFVKSIDSEVRHDYTTRLKTAIAYFPKLFNGKLRRNPLEGFNIDSFGSIN